MSLALRGPDVLHSAVAMISVDLPTLRSDDRIAQRAASKINVLL